MPPGKLERDGNAGLITLLVSNLLASLYRSLSSCPASRPDSAKRHCLNPQAWPAFLHCMPTANLLMSSWNWLSFYPASKTSLPEPTRNYSPKPWLYTCVSALPTATLLVSSWSWLSRVYTYLCPHCAKSMQSTVATGQVYHRRGDGCGKKFRVANGLLAGRTLAHTCPTCGTVVHSTKAFGQIQITHRTPNGKQCRTDRWPVQNWSQTEPSPNNRTLRDRNAETAGPWRTDRACRPPPSVPNVAFCTYKKTN